MVHRTYCDTLEECRQLLSKTSIFNYKRTVSILESLIEECQVYGNRMESALYYKGDLERLHRKTKRAKKKLVELNALLPEKDKINLNNWDD